MNRLKHLLVSALIMLAGPALGQTDTAHIAVAANFAPAMKQLITTYALQHDSQIKMVIGSSGKFYAQIIQGAPFDAFFSADQAKVAALADRGRLVKASRFTYANGRLVLFSRHKNIRLKEANALVQGNFNRLAIANPRLAPYGLAAEEVLQHLNLLDQLRPKLIKGENVGQTFQFLATGNADLGIIALSLTRQSAAHSSTAHALIQAGTSWVIPANWHSPIRQDAALILNAKNGKTAAQFMTFVRSDKALEIIKDFGYQVEAGPE